MSNSLLRATSLRRSYGGRNVVDIEELDVKRGEILALLGPNGSGKSTLFRLLLLIERPDAGQITLDGRPVQTRDASARRRMAGVFQQPYLYAGTVRDNIGFGLTSHRLPAAQRNQRIAAAASAFGIESLLSAHVNTLSGGEAQRVALARAFALRPDVLLLDEPTANLDALVKRTFREDIERAARTQAGAVVLITHDMAEAFGVADRVAVLDGGRILQSGTPEDILSDPRTPFVASFTGAELLLDGIIAAVAEELVHVDVGGAFVWATLPADRSWSPQRGMRTHVAYRPEDVMISTPDSSTEVSARNQYRLKVASMSGSGGLVRLRLDGNPQLTALITRTSVESLDLRPGRAVIAHLKATALRALRSA